MHDIRLFKSALSPRAWTRFHKYKSLFLIGKASERVRAFYTTLPPVLLLPIRGKKKFAAEWVPVAREITKQHNNLLPCASWLNKNGCSGLVRAMGKQPELFAGIDQERKWRVPADWVPVAKRLARQKGGTLPGRGWMTTHGYGGLDSAMSNHPELFTGIKQDSHKGKTPEQWLKIAKQIAQEHNNVLPNYVWLRDNGHSGLPHMIANHPELFSGIKRGKRGKTPEEWLVVARRLVSKKGGVLPNNGWLRDNGYRGLAQCMRTHPEMFSGIRQDRKVKSPDEWVLVAKQLARRNGGVLPCIGWLVKNGYNSLYSCMVRLPKVFAGIRQESKKGKTAKEWSATAKRLAREHGGTLPCFRWLMDNGYIGLPKAMLKYPRLFKGIQQERKNKAAKEWVIAARALAKQHNDVLPCVSWMENGYTGLRDAMKKHPRLFYGMKQQRKDTAGTITIVTLGRKS